MEIIRNAKVQEITGNGKAEILLLDTGTVLNIQGVFVAIGMIPQTEAVKDLVALDECGYIKAGEDGVTSVSGFFVAGDVKNSDRSSPQQQTVQMQRIQQYNISSESKNNSVQNTGWRNRKETTVW